MLVSLHIISPLLIGGLIYVCFRSPEIILNKIVYSSDLLSGIFIRIFPAIQFPDWFIFSLPDGLYVYAATSLHIYMTSKVYNAYSIKNIFYISFFSILVEFLQLINLIQGTFDFLDIIFMISGSFLSYHLLVKKNLFRLALVK